MNTVTAAATLVILLLGFTTAIILLNRGARITIIGHDVDAGQTIIKRLPATKNGTVRFKKPGGAICELILDRSYASTGLNGRAVYEADVSAHQGRLMRPDRSGEWLRMDGFRLARHDVSKTVRTVNQTAGADLSRLAMYGLIAVISLAFIVIGGFVYMVRLMNDSGMA